MNATLILLVLKQDQMWKDQTKLEDILDVDQFIEYLKDDVRIVCDIPDWFTDKAELFTSISHGLLCHRTSDHPFKNAMDNIDAVDWSVDGKFVAIARKDTVSILSPNFEETLGISLLFQSWVVDPGSKIKVDSNQVGSP